MKNYCYIIFQLKIYNKSVESFSHFCVLFLIGKLREMVESEFQDLFFFKYLIIFPRILFYVLQTEISSYTFI